MAFYNAATNTKHVIYQLNGFLNELSWTLGTLAPRYKDLTIAGVAPALVEYFTRPAAFVAGQTVHIPYRGLDGHVYEIVRHCPARASTVVTTWSLSSIPDAKRALAEGTQRLP